VNIYAYLCLLLISKALKQKLKSKYKTLQQQQQKKDERIDYSL
jgi:hypothetical protein